MEYIITVPVEFYPLDENNAACESAFAEHLTLLMSHIQQYASNIHIVAPAMSSESYESRKSYLKTLNRQTDNITVSCAYSADTGRLKYFFTKLIPVFKQLKKIIKNGALIHSGPSNDMFKPFEVFAIVLAVLNRRPSIFVVDIDSRDSAKMKYMTGKLSRKSYWLQKYIYGPYLSLQVKFAVKYCTLVLLKSKSMVRDYGKGSPHVKNFLDTAHSADAVIDSAKIEEKINRIGQQPFRLVYFGRLAEYKGIIDMIKAATVAKTKFNVNLELTIIGEGDQKPILQDIVKESNASEYIHFKGAMPYGKQLFDEIYQQDVLLAAPQSQDTPRNVFDAMSNGLATIAYDTYYYCDLESTNAVITTPWLDIDEFARAIASLAKNPERQKQMITSAVEFAKENTQEYWLNKRHNWLVKCLNNEDLSEKEPATQIDATAKFQNPLNKAKI
jgi:glycosyltransferase involved in cell wall biosynthesis